MSILTSMMAWFSSETVIVSVINFLMSIGSVSAIVAFLIPKLAQAQKASKEFQDIIAEIIKAQADGEITAEEIAKISAEGKEFLEAVKALIAKNKELKAKKHKK